MRKSVIEDKIARSVWNKMFAFEPCKKAYGFIGNCQSNLKPSPFGEDALAFIATAYFSKSFLGIDEVLYRYHYGRGEVPSYKQLTLNNFRRLCMQAISLENLRGFFHEQGEFENYEEIVSSLQTRWLNSCCHHFFESVKGSDTDEALQLLINYFPHDELVVQFGMFGHDAFAKMNMKGWEVPFKLLPKGGRIVLYGAGDVGQDYCRQILDSEYCEIALWVDGGYNTIDESSIEVYAPEEIGNANFDKVLIAVLDNATALSIKEHLTVTLNIPEKMIIWKDHTG